MLKRFTLLFLLILSVGVTRAEWGEVVGGEPFLKEFTVYPNPTAGELSLSIASVDPTAKLSIKVYSIIGQEMMSSEIGPYAGTQKVNLNMDKFPKGVYMIEISSGTQVKTKRVTLI